MSAHSKPNLAKGTNFRSSSDRKSVGRDSDTGRVVLFPTEPSAIGRRKIRQAVMRVAARKK